MEKRDQESNQHGWIATITGAVLAGVAANLAFRLIAPRITKNKAVLEHGLDTVTLLSSVIGASKGERWYASFNGETSRER